MTVFVRVVAAIHTQTRGTFSNLLEPSLPWWHGLGGDYLLVSAARRWAATFRLVVCLLPFLAQALSRRLALKPSSTVFNLLDSTSYSFEIK